MTVEMRDRKYGGRFVLHSEEDAKWKAAEDCSTNVIRHERKLQSAFLNSAKHVPNSLEKFSAKPRLFAVVPERCLEHVQLRLWADMERSHFDEARSRSSSRSRTSPHGLASSASPAR